MSEDKDHRKDMCLSMVIFLGSYRAARRGVGGPGLGKAGRYKWYHS
jgi:hypothetical protein